MFVLAICMVSRLFSYFKQIAQIVRNLLYTNNLVTSYWLLRFIFQTNVIGNGFKLLLMGSLISCWSGICLAAAETLPKNSESKLCQIPKTAFILYWRLGGLPVWNNLKQNSDFGFAGISEG